MGAGTALLLGCPDGGKRPLGGTCGSDEECESGLCLDGVCIDPNGDEDGDGLTNGIELQLGTDYRSVDTDGDGIDDLTEVGADPGTPRDADGDFINGTNTLHDALEPANGDKDGDCIFDQFDPEDRDVRGERAAEVCSRMGICGQQQSQLSATCTPGDPPVWTCDYGGVDGYTAGIDAACDGADVDCDGEVDEDFAGDAVTCGVGGCLREGAVGCVGGELTELCTPGTPAAGDVTCDGVDEDCDGETDEDYEEVATSCGRGACVASGTSSCQDGELTDSCAPGTPAADDASCDGVDEDCDGDTDEDYEPENTSCGAGACAGSGVTSCVDGQVADSCEAGAGTPQDASCDGVDDDCDGETDEDFVLVETSCGVGACAANGTRTCAGGVPQDSCVPGEAAANDDASCDGVDDDCDGEADEDYVATEITCGLGVCQRSGTLDCEGGAEVENCTPASPALSDATCDGVDDDCSGEADEDYVVTETTCGVGGCARAGTLSCVDGAEVDSCVAGGPASKDATCDGIDDDCSGTADEDYPQTETFCGVGECARVGMLVCEGGAEVDNCEPAEPDCGNAVCGSDGCGGICGVCPEPEAECLSVSCSGGACLTTVDPGWCYIDGACRTEGSLHPDNPCLRCSTPVSTDAWSNTPPGAACDGDGVACTEDVCDGEGSCEHPPLPELSPCNDGDSVTIMDGCWDGLCGGWVPRVEATETSSALISRASRGALSEGINGPYVISALEGPTTLKVVEYGAADLPSKVTPFSLGGTSTLWGISNDLLVIAQNIWEWVDGSWTSASTADSLRAAWNGCQEFCNSYNIVRRYTAPQSLFSGNVWGVGRSITNELVVRRCDPPGLCPVDQPCGWSCTGTSTEIVPRDHAVNIAFLGGKPLIGSNFGSPTAPIDIRVLEYDASDESWSAGDGFSAAGRQLYFFDVVGGGVTAGSPPETLIGGGSDGLLFASKSAASLTEVDLGLDPEPFWFGVTAFDGRVVMVGAQDIDRVLFYVLAIASLHDDLASPSSWHVVDLDPGNTTDAFLVPVADGKHLYLGGAARPAQLYLPARWRFSLPPQPTVDFRLGSFPSGWTTVCEGVSDPTANWITGDGYVAEAGNCHDANSADPGPLPKLGAYLWAKPVTFAEGRLSVTANPTDNDAWGVMYNVQDENNYYRVSFDRERGYARLVRNVNGTFTALGEDTTFSFPLGHWQRIDIERSGSSHVIRLNGGHVFTASDATFSGGSIALYGWGMSEIRFERVAIYPP